MKQYRYVNSQGEFDYEQYRLVQTKGNHRKILAQWVDENSIKFLAALIKKKVDVVKFGICHGTRRGLEQQWFSESLNCHVLGTEISDTALQFPNTIQWDFHDVKPEWINSVDFIYSNSWDHSYDPWKLFPAWMSCVRPGGICILEHSPLHTVADELDPLGMTVDEMTSLLDQLADGTWKREELVENAPPIKVNGKDTQKVKYHVLRRLPLNVVAAD
jgi:hypothetical protein